MPLMTRKGRQPLPASITSMAYQALNCGEFVYIGSSLEPDTFLRIDILYLELHSSKEALRHDRALERRRESWSDQPKFSFMVATSSYKDSAQHPQLFWYMAWVPMFWKRSQSIALTPRAVKHLGRPLPALPAASTLNVPNDVSHQGGPNNCHRSDR